MLGSYSMNFILLYLICGFTTAFFGIYILRRYFLGHTFGAVIVGVIGSFLGALFSTVLLQPGISLISAAIAVGFSGSALFIFDMVSKHYPD
ncbi:MAG: hypothetical protein B6241_07205 [Spirochaetaceae bacterium 4572_59]|nr:MAG: hypothetical protein B6241_07205 [Spirochaetaceae bacterium 4572_59]